MKSVEDAIALQLTNVKIPKSAEKKKKRKKGNFAVRFGLLCV